jgi:hypothetical protein
MADKTDKLQLLKTRYLERIRDTERTLAALKGKILLIDELESESAKLENGEADAPPAPTNGTQKTYEATGLTDAVFDVVQILGTGNGVSAPIVAGYLIGKGFKPKGKNFKISVGTTLNRLAKTNRIETKSENGHRLYMIGKYMKLL